MRFPVSKMHLQLRQALIAVIASTDRELVASELLCDSKVGR